MGQTIFVCVLQNMVFFYGAHKVYAWIRIYDVVAIFLTLFASLSKNTQTFSRASHCFSKNRKQ